MKRARKVELGAAVVAMLGLGGLAGIGEAADGDVDTSFGRAGFAVVDANITLHGNAMAVQADDKIIVAGSQSDAGEPDDDVVLVRLGVDGAMDTGFGDGGVVVTDIDGDPFTFDEVMGVATQPDGKIVVVGGSQSGGEPFVARYLPDGSLDSTFDGDGIATDELGFERPNSVAVQSDSKIVVAGAADDGWLTARYNADGSLDNTFGQAGIVVVGDSPGWPSSLSLQPDGRIVVVGSVSRAATVVRFDPDGSLDTGFGESGVVTADLGSGDPTASSATYAKRLVVQADGRLVVVGTFVEENSPDTIFLLRYNSDGSLDPTFDEDGLVMVQPLDVSEWFPGRGFLVHSDGGIVVVSETHDANDRIFVRRFASAGHPDTTFGDNGLVTIDVFGLPNVTGVVEQSNGKLVIGWGYVSIGAFRLGTLAGLVPELTIPVGMTNGITLRVSNYDPAFVWSIDATAGTATIDVGGTISVTGLAPGQSISVLVSTSRPGYENGSVNATGTALPGTLPETGATSGLTALIAAALTAIGGTVLIATRQRPTR